MSKMKKWMLNDEWLSECRNSELKEFIQGKFSIEDPVYVNNSENALQIDLTRYYFFRKRISVAVQVFKDLLGDGDFLFCEYGSIGLSDLKRYVIGRPNKINCIEYQTANPDIEYSYSNISYVRVSGNRFRFRKYARDVLFRKNFANSYYFIDLDRQRVVRMYDDRGMDILCDKKLRRTLYEKYCNIISYFYRKDIQKSIYGDENKTE